jgi:hypothetical protein
MYKPDLNHFVKNTLNTDQQAQTVAAFDEWYAGQPRDIQIVVTQHIATARETIHGLGLESAKILLVSVYLLVGKYDRMATRMEARHG